MVPIDLPLGRLPYFGGEVNGFEDEQTFDGKWDKCYSKKII